MASDTFTFERDWVKAVDGPMAVLVYVQTGFRLWVTTDDTAPTVDKYKAPPFTKHSITLAAGEQLWLTADGAPAEGSILTGTV